LGSLSIFLSRPTLLTSPPAATPLPRRRIAGRGPLPGKEWATSGTVRPIMTAYKVVRCNFKYFGLQVRACLRG